MKGQIEGAPLRVRADLTPGPSPAGRGECRDATYAGRMGGAVLGEGLGEILGAVEGMEGSEAVDLGDDEVSDDGLLIYHYRGTDARHRDNMGLRAAMAGKVPLVYLAGVLPGQYMAYWPVYIVDDGWNSPRAPVRRTPAIRLSRSQLGSAGSWEATWDRPMIFP